MRKQYKDTSWQKSSNWYNKLVGDKGHFYHQQIVIPGVLSLLAVEEKSNILDIGCGQGILAKQFFKNEYLGIDLSSNLINIARQQDRNSKHQYKVQDATTPFFLETKYSHAAAILSLQNMEKQDEAIKNVANNLLKNGKFVIVLNHPAFRIPRQSGWGVAENKVQYRYINMYMSFLKIPINMHPGEKQSEITWSFHYPLSYYAKSLQQSGFCIETIEEWTSSKESAGKMAKSENKSRNEIPLFMAILARKI
ncbi:MAG TPA: class I SAM-dependent methyltransferase [Patescibacteria group bacterium]